MRQYKLELLHSPLKQHHEFGGTPEGEGPVLPENNAHTERDNKSAWLILSHFVFKTYVSEDKLVIVVVSLTNYFF